MRRTIQHFKTDARGNVAMLFAMMSLVIFGVIGLAIDVGRAYGVRAELQQAADAAALAAAAKTDASEAQRIDIAKAIFRANTANSLAGAIEPVIDQTGSGSSLAIEITVDTGIPTTFANVAGISSLQVSVASAAYVGSTGSEGPNGPACLLALEPSDYGIKINGGGEGSHVTANCNVHVNSSASSAIFGNGKGTLTATKTCVRGNYDTSPTYVPAPVRGCPPLADPLAGRIPVPATAGCTFDKTKVNKDKSATLSPGIHCGGIDIGSDADVTFEPGIYVIKNGQFKIGSHAQARGNGVFFYLTGTNARIDFGSHAEIEFRAPSSGDYKGILVWAAEPLSNAHRLGCHSQSILQGTIYAPTSEIDIQSSGEVGASADWTVWVVKSLQLSSSAHLAVVANYTGSETPVPTGLLERLTPPVNVARLKQ